MLHPDPDGQAREADGKRISQSVVDAMTAKNLHRMRLGPGKHLKGQVLFDGIVKPEEVCNAYASFRRDRD